MLFLLAHGLAAPAYAQEDPLTEQTESREFHPALGLGVAAGLPPDALPITPVLSLAADVHARLERCLGPQCEESAMHGGAALGLSLGKIELKPLGIHWHHHLEHGDEEEGSEEEEGPEIAYRTESWATLDDYWALGGGISWGLDDEARGRPVGIGLVLKYAGFYVGANVENEDGVWSPRAEIGSQFLLNSGRVSVVPWVAGSPESFCGGVDLTFSHWHPHP